MAGRDGTIRIRDYLPARSRRRAHALLWLHGGGRKGQAVMAQPQQGAGGEARSGACPAEGDGGPVLVHEVGEHIDDVMEGGGEPVGRGPERALRELMSASSLALDSAGWSGHGSPGYGSG